MDLRQAAQQALEAWFRPHGINYVDFKPYMEALRAALAEPDSDYERGFVDGMNMQTKRSVDKAVNRMAEQEPVAWMYDFLNPNDREEVIRNWVTQNPDDIEREKGFNVRPLYTAPTPNTLEESNGDD